MKTYHLKPLKQNPKGTPQKGPLSRKALILKALKKILRFKHTLKPQDPEWLADLYDDVCKTLPNLSAIEFNRYLPEALTAQRKWGWAFYPEAINYDRESRCQYQTPSGEPVWVYCVGHGKKPTFEQTGMHHSCRNLMFCVGEVTNCIDSKHSFFDDDLIYDSYDQDALRTI